MGRLGAVVDGIASIIMLIAFFAGLLALNFLVAVMGYAVWNAVPIPEAFRIVMRGLFNV